MYYRAFFALPASIVDESSRPANAIRGTLNALSQISNNFPPRKILAAIDVSWRPVWRVELLPEYKTHRLALDGFSEEAPSDLVEQLPKIYEILNALGINIVGKENYEADDCLASIVKDETNCLIVTSDRDLLQLIDDKKEIKIYLQSDKNDPIWDYQRFRSVYNFEPKSYLEYALLRGDPSDGLKGVSKIGEKTASKMISDYENLDNLRKHLESKDNKSLTIAELNFLNSKEYLGRARKVTTLVNNLSFEIENKLIDLKKIEQLAKHYRVQKPIKELLQVIHD